MKVARQTLNLLCFLLITLAGSSSFATTKPVQGDTGEISTSEQVADYIAHHIKDSHDFHLFSYTDDAGVRQHVSFPLPVILLSSNGLVTFMSSEFHHNDDGSVIVEKKGSKFVKVHSKIYELDASASAVSLDAEHHPTNADKVWDFSITKSVFGILIAGLLLILMFGGLARQYKKNNVPTGFGRVLEPLVMYVRDEIARPNVGEKHYRRFTGYLLTVFFFIWVLNLMGLTPLGFNITGQLAVTAALAIFTLIIYIFSGNAGYWRHMLWMPGVPVVIRPVLAIIELAGAFIVKPFSLLVRLFANITAGHIIVMSLIGIMVIMKTELGPIASTSLSFLLSLFITLIELLVAFLQAYIFTMLSALFIGMAVDESDH